MDRSTLRKTLMILGGIGLINSIYLTVLKLAHSQAMCIQGLGDCWSVNNSPYSQIAGIPISIFGACSYLAILVLLSLQNRSGFWGENASLLIFGITLFGVLYSAYLTYIEIAVLRAICPFCVLSATIMGILFIGSIINLFRPQAEINP